MQATWISRGNHPESTNGHFSTDKPQDASSVPKELIMYQMIIMINLALVRTSLWDWCHHSRNLCKCRSTELGHPLVGRCGNPVGLCWDQQYHLMKLVTNIVCWWKCYLETRLGSRYSSSTSSQQDTHIRSQPAISNMRYTASSIGIVTG